MSNVEEDFHKKHTSNDVEILDTVWTDWAFLFLDFFFFWFFLLLWFFWFWNYLSFLLFNFMFLDFLLFLFFFLWHYNFSFLFFILFWSFSLECISYLLLNVQCFFQCGFLSFPKLFQVLLIGYFAFLINNPPVEKRRQR